MAECPASLPTQCVPGALALPAAGQLFAFGIGVQLCSCWRALIFFFLNEGFLEGDGKLPGFCRSYLGGSDVSRAGAGQGELALPGGAWQR